MNKSRWYQVPDNHRLATSAGVLRLALCFAFLGFGALLAKAMPPGVAAIPTGAPDLDLAAHSLIFTSMLRP